MTESEIAVAFWSFVASIGVVAVALVVLWHIIRSAVKRAIDDSGIVRALAIVNDNLTDVHDHEDRR